MRYMFVVTHPDEEVLGAGAFIHQIIRDGHEVEVIIMNADFEKTRKEMFEDIEKSHLVLGIRNRALFSFKNMDFYNEDHREMVERIEEELRSFQPDYIFTHSDLDLHNDHRITSICTQQAARIWQRHNSGYKPKALYFMEVQSSSDWSRHPFQPDTYVSVDNEDMEAKIEALKAYKNVVRERPHPLSVESIYALGVLRGSEIGYVYAEAFKTVWRDCL